MKKSSGCTSRPGARSSEEFEAIDVREAGPHDDGRPDLEHTLNRLSHAGTPISLRSNDALRRDMYFRYNQSFQEFFNAAASFRTVFTEET